MLLLWLTNNICNHFFNNVYHENFKEQKEIAEKAKDSTMLCQKFQSSGRMP